MTLLSAGLGCLRAAARIASAAGCPVNEDLLELDAAPEGEEVVSDYASLELTLRSHPLALPRPLLAERRLLSAKDLLEVPDGCMVRCSGILTLRQQPEKAKGAIFNSLEAETGIVQVICWKSVREVQRKELLRPA